MTDKKHVIVLGLGDAGVLVAQGLARACKVTVITPRPYYLSAQNVGGRLAWPSAWERIAKIGTDRFKRLDGVEIVQGLVTSLDLGKNTVTSRTSDGAERTDSCDALVIATGTENGFWRKTQMESWDEEAARRKTERAALGTASGFAIVGGGGSGISLAAGLAARYPDRSVSLYHSGDELLPAYPDKTRRKVHDQLERLGVRICPNHRAKPPDDAERMTIGPGTVEWTSGQPPVEADCIIWAIGNPKPNSGFLPNEILTEDGFVKVEPTLQVTGHETIFSVGDIAATDPHRCSARNFGSEIVVANVKQVLGLSNRSLKQFKPPKHRWGELITSPIAGMTLFTPSGRRVQMPNWFTQSVIFDLILFRFIYGGVRKQK